MVAAIRVNGLTKRFGATEVLRGIDCPIAAVAGRHRQHAVEFLEYRFNAPETAASEHRPLFSIRRRGVDVALGVGKLAAGNGEVGTGDFANEVHDNSWIKRMAWTLGRNRRPSRAPWRRTGIRTAFECRGFHTRRSHPAQGNAQQFASAVIPAQAGIHLGFTNLPLKSRWIPAFAGKTI